MSKVEYPFKGRVFSVKVERVKLPNGRVMSVEAVEHPGAVAILPVLDDGRIILLKQYRPTIKEWLYEIPAGTLKPGEDPDHCAIRELEEETGFTAGELVKLFSMYLAPGYSTEVIHIYLARRLQPAEQRLEKDEVIELSMVTLDEALHMIEENAIRDAKTISALLYALHFSKNLP